MTRAQRFKTRVFKIDIETCSHCSGAVKVIACIEDSAIIKRFWIISTTEPKPPNRCRIQPGGRRRPQSRLDLD
jgi:hypothetical protein